MSLGEGSHAVGNISFRMDFIDVRAGRRVICWILLARGGLGRSCGAVILVYFTCNTLVSYPSYTRVSFAVFRFDYVDK